MTNRSNDPWNRANDPWNRSDEPWEAYPAPEHEPSVSDPPPDIPVIKGYPAEPPTPTPPTAPPSTPTSPASSPSAPNSSPAAPSSAAPSSTRPATDAVASTRPRLRGKLLVLAVAVMICLVGGLITSTVLNNTDTDLTTVWSLTPEDVLPGEYGYRFSETLDGTEGTDFLVTDSVWVALLMDRTTDAPAQLLGIDPDSGDPAWHLELPGAICADRPSADGTLACLSEQTDGWQITRVDLSTGEVAESVPAEVSEPRQVHLVADGLLVVGESEPSVHSQLTHLGADGAARWSTDLLELVGGETLFRESSTAEDVEEVTLDSSAAWTDVGDAVLLGHDNFVHIVPDTEQVQVHQGNYLAVVDDRFFYKTSPGSVGYDAAGTKVWHQPDVELVRSTEARPTRSLLHLGTSERDLRTVDPATGELSDPIHTFDDSSGTLQMNGPPDETYVIRQEEVLRLSPDRGKVLWTAEVPDANSLSHGLVVGGATVVTTSPLTGLDPATGEELWTAEAESRDLSVVDGRLVAFDRNSLAVHDLP